MPYGLSFSFLFRVSVLLLPLKSLSSCSPGATRYLKLPDVIFCIAAGHAISAKATSQRPVRLGCSGHSVVKSANVLSANVAMDALDTKFIVNSFSDLVFDGVSIRKTCERSYFSKRVSSGS